MEETWVDIKGYEGKYQVSNLGNVRSLNYHRTGKIKLLSTGFCGHGYKFVNLYSDGVRKEIKVHRLVAKAFPEICGEYKEGMEIDHKNTIKTDNRAVNLHWCSSKENNNNPLTRQHKSEAKSGENHPRYGKLGEDNPLSVKIVQLSKAGELIKVWNATWDVERECGFHQSHIVECCKGKIKSAYGYHWKYYKDYIRNIRRSSYSPLF